MGVRGLSSFMDCNPQLTKSHKLHDCGVIIDGNNLIHFLYFSHKLDCIFGGDYNKFADVVRKYFRTLLECNIKPIVIFDGGYDPSDRKLKTVLERTKQRLTNIQHIAKYGSCSQKVLPILAVIVTRIVLKSMNITYAQCDFEADEQLVVLANHFNYPVISQDSDFYIFDILPGFIRLDLIDEDVSKMAADDEGNNPVKCLECRIYFVDHFLSAFTNMDKNILPLFSTLMGNDISNISTFEEFFSNIQLPKFKSKLKVSQRHKKMVGLLGWLQNRTVESAKEQVLARMKLKKRQRVKNVIDLVLRSYNTDSRIILDESRNVDLNISPNDVRTFHGKPLPLWFLKESRSGQVSSFLLNAIYLHRNFLPSQVEDLTLESSFQSSLYVRQIIYGILLSYESDVEDFENYVVEYDRRSGNLQKIPITPVYHIDGYGSLPLLDRINNLDLNSRRTLLERVIGDAREYFNTIPLKLQLLFGAMRYWLRHCQPKPTVEILNAFLITHIYFTCATSCDEKYSDDLLNDVSSKEIPLFLENMKKYLPKPHYNNANPIRFRIIHYFSQLQTCILYFTYFNELLCGPFIQSTIFQSFNGSVYYNLCKDLRSRCSPDLYIAQLFGKDSKLLQLYLKLKQLVLENLHKDCLSEETVLNKPRSAKVSKNSKKKSNIFQIPSTKAEIDQGINKLENLEMNVDSEVDVIL